MGFSQRAPRRVKHGNVLVTAEGIEDAAALEYLRRRRCTLGQGYLFSRAVPVDDFDPGRRYDVLA